MEAYLRRILKERKNAKKIIRKRLNGIWIDTRVKQILRSRTTRQRKRHIKDDYKRNKKVEEIRNENKEINLERKDNKL